MTIGPTPGAVTFSRKAHALADGLGAGSVWAARSLGPQAATATAVTTTPVKPMWHIVRGDIRARY
jgi:hypothetical protein